MTTESENKEFQFTTGTAGLIGLTAFGGALIGFVLQLLVAFYFGASNQTDAYFMALSTSELLSKLLLGGSITAVFIPMFIERLTQESAHNAWHLALNIFHLTTAAMLAAIVLLGAFTEPFVNFIAPGFDAPTKVLTIHLLRVLLPSFIILFLVQLTTSMLHALKQFTIPALLRVIAPVASIISIIILVRPIGIYSLAVGTVIGALLQFALLAWGLKKNGFSYRFVMQPHDPAVKKLLYLVYPFILSVVITQGAGITYRILVSDLATGSLAALKFAEKITQLLVIIFLNSVTLVIYPLLSEKASKKDYNGIRSTVAAAMRLISFTTAPIIIGVSLLREPLIAFLYQRGSFTPEDAALTSSALLFLVIGLTTNGLSAVLGYTTLALQETRASVAITIASQALAISLFVLLVPHMAHNGLALASSLVPVGMTLLYYLYLSRFIPNLGTIFFSITYVKIGVLALLLAGSLILTLPLTQRIQAPHTLALLMQLIIPTVIGSSIFFGGAYLWKIPEMNTVLEILHNKVKKWHHANNG